MRFVTLSIMAPGHSLQAREAPSILEEVKVTAQKREDSLQRVAASVSVLPGDLLQRMGVSDSSQLAEVVPNLSIRTERPGQSFPVIRGIGSPIQSLDVDPGVAIYLDGVQVDSPVANLVSVLDLERIEVLRGPQGTLYGRNAIGGVINLVSRIPQDAFTGRARAGVGRTPQSTTSAPSDTAPAATARVILGLLSRRSWPISRRPPFPCCATNAAA